jgi:phosphoglycolate phosphatase
MLLATLRDTGVAPRDAVLVGDTSFDMDMARAAGVAAIGVGWGYHPAADLQRAGAACVLERFEELDDALGAIWEMSDG